VGDDQPVRLLALPISAQGHRLVAIVGQSLEERNRAIDDLTKVLLVGGPAALLLASLAGYALTAAALRPVEVMRRRERRFVADASHELRSPLTMLRTELELMARDAPAGDELQAATASAIEETDRLGRLADDLLLLTRADSERFELHPRPVSPAELAGDAAARARRRPASARIRIAVRDAGDTPLVLADPGRTGQALDNMLDNALRYAASEIELTTRRAGSSVEIHVRDDGPGFPPAFLPRAWERFARADAARTDDGAGLGLSIIRTIAELHGGAADAANRQGGGADVWLSLPAA
jgi:signal transduction histidine kinase